MPHDRALLVVAKKPIPGQTKTRLCPPLTYSQAADLYSCFLRDTLDTMREVSAVKRMIGYMPDDAQDFFCQLAPDMELICQRGDSLGERLDGLFNAVLNNGFRQAVVMDSDSPTLPASYLKKAFKRLAEVDVVLGPTHDGGYYLIGLKRPQPHLLCQVQMSTAHVLTDTLKLVEASGLTASLLPAWYDVDDIADLYQLSQHIIDLDDTETARATHRWLTQTAWHNKTV